MSVVTRFSAYYEMPLDSVDGGVLEPQFRVSQASKLEVYRGKKITAITVDEDQSILYIAETENERLVSINYSPEKLLATSNSVGKVTYIYEDPSQTLGDVQSLAVNLMGKVFWSNSQDGKQDGALISASADRPSEKSIKIESKLFDAISNLYYKNQLLFFTAPVEPK